jgi:hypothetical protein
MPEMAPQTWGNLPVTLKTSCSREPSNNKKGSGEDVSKGGKTNLGAAGFSNENWAASSTADTMKVSFATIGVESHLPAKADYFWEDPLWRTSRSMVADENNAMTFDNEEATTSGDGADSGSEESLGSATSLEPRPTFVPVSPSTKPEPIVLQTNLGLDKNRPKRTP